LSNKLTHEQWSRLNRFVLDLNADRSREHFFTFCLEELPHLLGLSWVGWTEMNEHYPYVDVDVVEENVSDVRILDAVSSPPVNGSCSEKNALMPLPHDSLQRINQACELVSEQHLDLSHVYREATVHLDTLQGMYDDLYAEPDLRPNLTRKGEPSLSEEQRMMAELALEHLVIAFRHILSLEEDEQAQKLSWRQHHEAMIGLSPRQQEVLNHLLQGLPRKQIAEVMGLSIHTINEYIRSLYARLNVHSQAEVMALFSAAE